MSYNSKKTSRGFTLVELLVVIGIIALLISILLPSLAKARRAAQNIACAANLRSILQATHIFASQNKGYIPGSAYSSGRFLFIDPVKGRAPANLAPQWSDDKCPDVIQYSDWASPIAKIMGVKFDEGETDQARARRYVTMRDLPQFRCPNNDIIALQFGASVDNTIVSTGRMVSYNTAMGFLLTNNSSGTTSNLLVGVSISRPEWNVPTGYNAKISKVGDPSKKVFIADGAKYSTSSIQPDADLNYISQLGGAFADQGPTKFTRAWNRDAIPGNGGGGTDCRVFWARHGSSQVKPGAKSGAFRFNIGFFDGHVETVDDREGANPYLWYPKGTSLTVNATQMYNDVLARYFPGGTGVFIVP